MDALAEKLRRKRLDIEAGADPLGAPVDDFDGEELARTGIKDPAVARHVLGLVMGQKPAQEGPDTLGLLQAQKQAAGNSAWNSVQRGMDIAGAAIGGTKPLTDLYADREKAAGQPVEDFAARDGMRRQGVTDARAEKKFGFEMAGAERTVEDDQSKRDPSSPLSVAKRASLKKLRPGLVAGIGEQFDSLSSAQIDSLLPWAKESLDLDLQNAKIAAYGRAKPKKEDKGRDIPAGEAAQIGEYDAVDEEITALDRDWEKLASDWYSGMAQYLPGTDAKQYGDAQLLQAQSIGTAIEGGKLTDSDLKDKYLPLMPTAGDSKERKNAKLERLREMARTKKRARVTGLKQAGFNTSGFKDGHMDLGGAPAKAADADKAVVEKDGKRLRVPRRRLAEAVRDGWAEVK